MIVISGTKGQFFMMENVFLQEGMRGFKSAAMPLIAVLLRVKEKSYSISTL